MITYSRLGRMGRFGNAMFQIAGTIGVAIKNGQEFGFPPWRNHDAKERFGQTENTDLSEHFEHALPAARPGAFQVVPYFWGYQELSLPQGDWDLESHFQSTRYFEHCIETVRHYLTMKRENPYTDTIALHIRRGDYDGDYHPIQTVDYYREALELMPADAQLYVFSDDMTAAAAMMKSIPKRFVRIDAGYLESFRIMKRCKYFICANSTYSLMASILADHPDKRVVAPRRWFGPACGDPVGMAKDLYPPGTVIL